jgi:hypothetical protein
MNWNDRRHNDDGDGGVCTFCGRLHTVVLVHACRQCLHPADGPGSDYCAAYPDCLTPAQQREVELAADAAARSAAQVIRRER